MQAQQGFQVYEGSFSFSVGTTIPPGSTVLINSYLLHRDARYFPEPHIYRPERFLPGGPRLPNYAFIPFSAGSRNCIGWKFATIIVKVVVLLVLKAFHVEALNGEDQLRFKSELVLVNADGIRLKITPRGRWEGNIFIDLLLLAGWWADSYKSLSFRVSL